MSPAPDLAVLAEPERVQAVDALVRSAGPSERLAELAALAAELTGAPRATVSLVGARSQVIAAAHGLEVSGPARRVPLDASICAMTAATGDVLALPDTAGHPWTEQLPAVRAGVVGSYLGAPIRDDAGRVVGAVGVHDPRARDWTDADRTAVQALSVRAQTELERLLAEGSSPGGSGSVQLELAVQAAQLGVFSYDVATGGLAWDARMRALHGYGPDDAFSGTVDALTSVVHPDDLPGVQRAVEQAFACLGEVSVEYRVVLPAPPVEPTGDRMRWVAARGRVVPDLLGEPGRVLGAAFDRSPERELAAELQATSARLEVLARAGAALSASLSPHDVLDVLVDILVPQQAASLVLAVTPDVAELLGHGRAEARTDLHPARLKHADPRLQETLEAVIDGAPLSVTAPSGVGRAVRTGESQLLERVPDALLHARASSPEHLAQMRSLDLGPSLSVPLRSARGTVGAITVTAGPDQRLDELLVTDVARRAAVALENALDHTRASRVTRELQTALLPRDPDGLPGVRVASRYLPAATGALAGGDFFKTLAVGNRLVAVLGDVMGHGAVSAARAGQLHALVAVLARRGLEPGPLLECLAADIGHVMDLELATVLVCSYDPTTGELLAASAGHPPPLLAGAAATGEVSARYLDVLPGPPVGVAVGEYAQARAVLTPGEVAVLFSDGLVERRGEDLGAGLERLRAAVVDHLRERRPDPEAVACGVLTALGCSGGAEDDVALLVLAQV